MNPEKEKRIMLKQQRQQRVKVQLWEQFQIGKIYPKSLQSIFHKGAITFFFAVMRVPYVILAAQLQLLRTFKSYSSAKLFPSSAVMPWIGEAKKQREFVEQAKAAGLRPQTGADPMNLL